MKIKKIDREFSVCKVPDYSLVDMDSDYIFTGSTDEEKSLVCPSEDVPANALEVDGGWGAFRIQGPLDFSLIGILAGISGLLAENKIGIFAVSTFDTDYILTKKENFQRALDVLAAAGYEIIN